MEQWLTFCSSCIRSQFQSVAFSEVVEISPMNNLGLEDPIVGVDKKLLSLLL